ncbi:hypothetical protein C8R43DRAFT_1114167 [Mycena crocata]|nr:hypothetical protein C8R43DRAFT_1114167 [Mycena crocata]
MAEIGTTKFMHGVMGYKLAGACRCPGNNVDGMNGNVMALPDLGTTPTVFRAVSARTNDLNCSAVEGRKEALIGADDPGKNAVVADFYIQLKTLQVLARRNKRLRANIQPPELPPKSPPIALSDVGENWPRPDEEALPKLVQNDGTGNHVEGNFRPCQWKKLHTAQMKRNQSSAATCHRGTAEPDAMCQLLKFKPARQIGYFDQIFGDYQVRVVDPPILALEETVLIMVLRISRMIYDQNLTEERKTTVTTISSDSRIHIQKTNSHPGKPLFIPLITDLYTTGMGPGRLVGLGQGGQRIGQSLIVDA